MNDLPLSDDELGPAKAKVAQALRHTSRALDAWSEWVRLLDVLDDQKRELKRLRELSDTHATQAYHAELEVRRLRARDEAAKEVVQAWSFKPLRSAVRETHPDLGEALDALARAESGEA